MEGDRKKLEENKKRFEVDKKKLEADQKKLDKDIIDFNSRMAQTTEWLQAIWNYMKKVKLSISMVFGRISCSEQLITSCTCMAVVSSVYKRKHNRPFE